jgi:hypothetical protein
MAQMVKNEVRSTMSTGTDQTMFTQFRKELAESRVETQKQMAMMQTQMNTIITKLLPQAVAETPAPQTPTTATTAEPASPSGSESSGSTPNSKDPETDSNDNKQANDSNDNASQNSTPKTNHHSDPSNPGDPSSPPTPRRVNMEDDADMPVAVAHDAPLRTGKSPPPKRTNRTPSVNLQHLKRGKNTRQMSRGNKIISPTQPPSTTITAKKSSNGGRL